MHLAFTGRLFILTLLCCLRWSSNGCEAAQILVLFPHASESHFAVLRTLVAELASREHNVTVYTSHGLSERLDNVTEVVVTPEYDFWLKLQEHAVPKGTLADLSRIPNDALRRSLAIVGANALDHFLQQAPLQVLLQKSTAEFNFDAIVVDLFYTEALLALGHKHNTPTIGIISTDFGDYMNAVQESIVPVACSPIDFESYLPELSFWTRLEHIRECIKRRKQFIKQNYGAQEKLIQQHFRVDHAVTVLQLQAELSVLLLNSHVPLLTPRPLLQHIVTAGGLHIRGPRDLPWNIKRFLEESRVGVIYVQLGNEQLCGQIPKQKLETLLEFLGARRERVIWTCHDFETLKNVPKNVMIQHNIPQIDILAHPNIQAFIMNGDILSLQEGIVRHVPMLGLPIFANEVKNMQTAVELGVALQLDNDNVTLTSLKWAFDELLTNKKYHLSIRQVSTEYRDRPLGALATAMFWVNYVLRHNGGAAIKTRGIGIVSSELHLYDLFMFYCGVAFVLVGLIVASYFVFIIVWRKKHNATKYSKLN